MGRKWNQTVVVAVNAVSIQTPQADATERDLQKNHLLTYCRLEWRLCLWRLM